MKKGFIILGTLIICGVIVVKGLKSYTKINYGKEKRETGQINNYILGSVVYQLITTALSAVCMLKFL
ncbi:TPA: hypothetical protein N2D99_002105 [Clostridium botulinum]|nr:hypothetical protein [Clostridium botulinum]